MCGLALFIGQFLLDRLLGWRLLGIELESGRASIRTVKKIADLLRLFAFVQTLIPCGE